jgi:hypothetical protein
MEPGANSGNRRSACSHEAVYTANGILDLNTTAPPYVYILPSATPQVDIEAAT